MRPSLSPPLRAAGSAKLFAFGATIGPIVDSLHNQCLLRYKIAHITIPWPESLKDLGTLLEQDYLLCSSWSVPLLLGFAYVVLGDLLPRFFQYLLTKTAPKSAVSKEDQALNYADNILPLKAISAVFATAAIIKLSQYLELHQPFGSAGANYVSLLLVTIVQWWVLDGTLPALLSAGITSVGGPLSELPFVANGFWEYLPQAADYLPLANAPDVGGLLSNLLGDKYQELALSSITGPCYFAVTLDAIALGRWFQSSGGSSSREDGRVD